MGNVIVACDVCKEPLSRPGGSQRTVHPACGLVIIGRTALVAPNVEQIAAVNRSRS